MSCSNDTEPARSFFHSPIDTHRLSAAQARFALASRVFAWNQMRRSDASYAAVPETRCGKDIASNEEVAAGGELEEEILSAFRAWICEDVYWYIREALASMCVGVDIVISFSPSASSPSLTDTITRTGNGLCISISPYLQLLAYTPAIHEISTQERAECFFAEVACDVVGSLREDGYDVYGLDSWVREMPMSEIVLGGMISQRKVRMRVRWATDEYAAAIEKLQDEAQMDALRAGVPIEDILA